jgi:peptidylamidoglycolate lyase
MLSRRACLSTLAAGVCAAADNRVLGQGQHRYRVVPGWGVLDAGTPVKNCHGLVRDAQGHIILLTDHVSNNVVVYDKRGRLISKWGKAFPGAHGLSIVAEGGREVLFITDLQKHTVTKTSLDGKVLDEWGWPASTGKYREEADYKPSWTLHMTDGTFFVLDGYGQDFIVRYDAQGKMTRIFGGAEGGIPHWGPHGGMLDIQRKTPTLLIAMSDQQYLLRLSIDGEKLQQVELPGGNPRQIRLHKGRYYVAHLADNWPKDRDSRGFVSILDENLQVVSNIAGSSPEYTDDGKLRPMRHTEDVFLHPHDVVVDEDDSLYVAQFASGATYPIKLERV